MYAGVHTGGEDLGYPPPKGIPPPPPRIFTTKMKFQQ